MAQASPQNVLKARLLAMMVLRVVLALAFLGITTWFQIREYSSLRHLNFYPIYAIVAVIGLITILYSLALGRVRNLRAFAYVQTVVDIAVITLIVYVTGGTESYLHVLYLLSIIGGSIILRTRGGLFAASVSSIAYGVLIDMDFYAMLPLQYKVFHTPLPPAWKDVFTTVATNILAYFTIAYLTGYLAERTAKAEKRLEEREIDLEKLERLNRHIVENITSGIMTLDDRLRITSFNKEAERVTGFTLKEVYYRGVNEIFPDMITSGSETFLAQAGFRVEKMFRRKDGTDIFLGFTVSAGHGVDVDKIVIFQDLTQLKAMEEQLRRDEKLKALGELSVGIAHEIRNPLASISGSIQVLKGETSLTGENLRLMEIVLRETERLNALITDYLLFARPAEGRKEAVDLGAVIRETVEVFRNCQEASGIIVESSTPEGTYILGSSRQIGQVFWNLFLNAAQAMPGGGVLRITARVAPQEDFQGRPSQGFNSAVAHGYVEIEVADTGGGIKAEHLPHIFDPFFSTKDSGTGLGLAIVHRIIESHGGSIEVKNAAGGGAVFTITLPVEGAVAPIHT